MRCNVVQSTHDGQWFVWWETSSFCLNYAYGKTKEEAIKAAEAKGFDTTNLNNPTPWLEPGEDPIPF